MNIVIEVNPLISLYKTGITTYIDGLCRALLDQRSDHRFVLYGPDLWKDPFPEYDNKVFQGGRRVMRRTLEKVWKDLGVGGMGRDVDVYHATFPALHAPRKRSDTKLVATVYDLAFAHYPESVDSSGYFRTLMESMAAVAEQADAIVAISESTRRDVVTFLGVPEERVHVAYPGIDLVAPEDTEAFIRDSPYWKQFGIPERYILSVGTWEPRKNLPNLFRALSLIADRLRQEEIYVCMTGMKGWKYSEAEQLIEELGIADRIKVLGHVPRGMLPTLYARAQMFVYPSLFEGFGLPVTEAMICGTPVITSNVSSLPEAGGDAALLIDPHHPAEIASAILDLLDHPAKRLDMVERGRRHGSCFSWDKVAQRHLEIYES
jgi:glycosyltransferase involved in cell wall biosynthesis